MTENKQCNDPEIKHSRGRLIYSKETPPSLAKACHQKSTTLKKLTHSISIKQVLTWYKVLHQNKTTLSGGLTIYYRASIQNNLSCYTTDMTSQPKDDKQPLDADSPTASQLWREALNKRVQGAQPGAGRNTLQGGVGVYMKNRFQKNTPNGTSQKTRKGSRAG